MPKRQRDLVKFNAAWMRWYRANSKRKMQWQARRREELRQWLFNLRATKQCERCGESAPECLHFHHVDPQTKEFDIATAVANGVSRARILAEVAKCAVLCANCHFKHHWDERVK